LAAAWIALDKGDNDPVRFWRYVISAFQGGDETIGGTALTRLGQPPQPNYEAVLTSFINDLAPLTEKRVLVLEDYHHIATPIIHTALMFLIEQLPPSLHLVMITRADCPLPLARLRVQGDMNEISTDDLRFSRKEIQSFFQKALSIDLKADTLKLFQDHTEGWAAGLRLATLSLKNQLGSADVGNMLASFSGKHQFVAEYLAEEVLATQPSDIQDFLLQTSFLSRMTGDLCDSVTGRDDSAGILKTLQRANMFITTVDGEGRWYRYHALFAEAMQTVAQQHFGNMKWHAFHDKASCWYEQHGFIGEAIELRFIIQDYQQAAHLIAVFIERTRLYTEHHTLQRWFDQLPLPVLEQYPALCFTYAITSLFTRDRRSLEVAVFIDKLLRIVEERWRSEENFEQLGRAFALRAMVAFWQGDLQAAFAAARHAHRLLPERDYWWRGVSLIQNGYEELMAGRNGLAKQYLIEAHAANVIVGNEHGASASRLLLAKVHSQQGEYRQAQQIYQEIYDNTVSRAEFRDDLAHAITGLAALAYEWNDLQQAEQLTSEAIVIAEELGARELLVPAVLILAKARHAQGEPVEAQQILRSTLASVHIPLLARELHLVQAHLALLSGDMESVQRWHASLDSEKGFTPHILQEREALLLARLFIEEGKLDAALRLLKQWQTDANEKQRTPAEMEINILQAMAYDAQGRPMQAHRFLERALSLGQVESQRRVFLDEGERLGTLLRETLPEMGERAYAVYARILLVAFAQQTEMNGEISSLEAATLIKPLTEQERRVLRLLAAGLSKPEIAEQFVVSVNTVKTQVKSIYYKLNVSNRQQATEVARRLDL
jgi:LuxR family maltose regulon positive regulatory protein